MLKLFKIIWWLFLATWWCYVIIGLGVLRLISIDWESNGMHGRDLSAGIALIVIGTLAIPASILFRLVFGNVKDSEESKKSDWSW